MNRDKDCIFCRIIRKEIPADLVYEDDETVAFKDINPQAPVHVVVIPKQHIQKVSDIKKESPNVISGLVEAGNKAAVAMGLEDKGYRFVVNCGKDAGQEVPHLHMHVLGGRKLGWPPG